jgi:hypothetical protein
MASEKMSEKVSGRAWGTVSVMASGVGVGVNIGVGESGVV